MKVTLIVSTRGRANEVERLLSSVARQTYRGFELRLSDQNEDDRLGPILYRFQQSFRLERLRTSKGLSRGRNAGLSQPLGDIVAFPDDDCWYPENLLEQVVDYFHRNLSIDAIAAKPCFSGLAPIAGPQEVIRPTAYTRANIFDVGLGAISYCIFLRRRFVEAVGGFDETLGVGAGTPWGSGEESDYLIRGLQQQMRIEHVPSLSVFHPMKGDSTERMYLYACGYGRVLAKHRYPKTRVLWDLARPLAMMFAQPFHSAGRHRRWNFVRGLISGYLDPTPFLKEPLFLPDRTLV